jgi:hypothetical protein
MLRDIIETAVRSQPDMELVEGEEDEDLELVAQSGIVDVAIVGGGVSLGDRMLVAKRQLKVLVSTGDGHTVDVFALYHHSLAEPSPQSLLDAIRQTLQGKTGLQRH